MADEKSFSDGYVDVIVIRKNQLTDPKAPSAEELNTLGINVSKAIAWDNTTWPNNTDSTDTDDRSIKDVGNATSRGFAQFEATLNFFFPKDLTDTTSDYGKAYQFFKAAADRIPVYLVTRILQTVPNEITPVLPGDLISVFDMLTDAVTDDTEGDDSYKYGIGFLPQGNVYPYTQAVAAAKSAILVTTPGTLPAAVGDKTALRATLNGKRMTNQMDWVSSDSAVVTTTPNGVITAVGVGTANITAEHPAGTTSAPLAITVA